MSDAMEGKAVIVTCAGQDIGRAVAKRFLEEGASVMLADSDESELDSTSALLEEHADRLAQFHYIAQDKLCITNLVAATLDKFERIDVLVNSAQTVGEPASFLKIEREHFDLAMGNNVNAVFQLSQAVAKRMIARIEEDNEEWGAIVNISSIAAVRTVPALLSFSVSCAALDQLTRSMAASLASQGIRVNGVALGGVMTERLLSAFREHDELRDEMIKVTPMGRLAEMEEAAEAVLYLASERASYVTGQVLGVDGGRTLLDPLASPVR
ncbi:MAG: SDR family oxidoreductase [Pseudomonadota bacterium]